MNFSDSRANSQPLFKEQKILKVEDNIFLQNCLFVYDYFKGNLPKSFHNIFTKTENIHSIFTRNANKGIVVPNMFNTITYGQKSIYNLCIEAWNKLINEQKRLDNTLRKLNNHDTIDLYNIPRTKLKTIITNSFLNTY